MINLPPRLEAVYNQLESERTQKSRIIDVGSDHALLSISVLENKLADFVIATDINKAPAERSRRALIEAGYEFNSKVYHTNGIQGVELCADDTVVIAGMGGNNIIDIMGYALNNVSSDILTNIEWIIQPQKSLDKVRDFLSTSGFNIIDEKVALDNDNYYVIMKVIYTGEVYSIEDEARFYGPVLLKKTESLVVDYFKHLDEVYVLRSRGDNVLRQVLKKRGINV